MKVDLGPLPFYFHDLCSCLQDCFGTLLLAGGHDPVEVLGAAWEFSHDPAQVRPEEFYYPAPRATLGENIAPFHPLRATWVEASGPDEAWELMRKTLEDGRPLIAAVDNFHMPNRPAHGDVHAAHLAVVSGFDDDADVVDILESTPPTYRDPIPRESFLRAIGSRNESRSGTRDYFFAGAQMGCRWIDVELGDPFPEPTPAWVREVIAANLRGFAEPSDPDRRIGVGGLRWYLDDVRARAAAEGSQMLGELYTVGWAAQSAAALHADFVRQSATVFGWSEGLEAARMVERVANLWTPLRIFAAHASTNGIDVDDRLPQRMRDLVEQYELALAELAVAVRLLDPVHA
jgi:hypothetical protein